MIRCRSKEDVELNVASMLDMAFQLLAFFIMTFRPPPNEGAIALRMPLPHPIGVPATGPTTCGGGVGGDVQTVKTLTIELRSRGGALDAIRVGVPSRTEMTEVAFNQLDGKLSTFLQGSLGFEQVLIMAAPNLHWGEVMRVAEVCSNQRLSDGSKLAKLNFRSMGPPGPGP